MRISQREKKNLDYKFSKENTLRKVGPGPEKQEETEENVILLVTGYQSFEIHIANIFFRSVAYILTVFMCFLYRRMLRF